MRPKLIKNERPRLKPLGEEMRRPFFSWLWICAIATLLGMVLAAAFARAQDERPFLACPPEAKMCVAKGKAPASPQVDRACLRRLGSTAILDTLCVAVQPDALFEIPFSNPTPGNGHVRFELVACDDDLGLCSAPAEPLAIAVDLDVPSFFEVLRQALGL